MATRIWFPPAAGFPRNTTTAAVSAWIEDLRQTLIGCGLVQTADTGQFDSSTFAWSDKGELGGSSVEVTYLMFRFDDALQASSPIFIRIGMRACFGRSNTGYSLCGNVTVGRATNGAGSITGSSANIQTAIGYSNDRSYPAGTSYQSFASYSKSKGFAGLVYNAGMNNFCYTMSFSPIAFFIERVPDATGAPTADGFTVWGNNQTFNYYGDLCSADTYNSVRNMAGITLMANGFNSGESLNTVPYFSASDLISGDVFALHAYHSTPKPVRSNGLCAIRHSISKGTEFDLHVYGTESSRFVAMDFTCALRPCMADTRAKVAFLFE